MFVIIVTASPLCQDYDRGSLYGLEKFWAFHHYSGLPKDSGFEINPKVRVSVILLVPTSFLVTHI